MNTPAYLDLEDLATATYSAIDDALAHVGMKAVKGKLIQRPGPPPEVDDREILCLALLQEFLGFESDNEFYLWLETNATIKELFPRRLSRPNFAERRTLLSPIIERLTLALCELQCESDAPFLS